MIDVLRGKTKNRSNPYMNRARLVITACSVFCPKFTKHFWVHIVYKTQVLGEISGIAG